MELFDFQEKEVIRASQILKTKNGYGLFWDVGTGKTITSLSISKISNKIVIVCPKSLIYQWRREIKKFDLEKDREIYVVEGNRKQAISDFTKTENKAFLLINYEALRIEKPEFKNCFIIFDEAQKLKSYKAKITKVVSKLYAKNKKILTTATPYETKLMDFYNITNICHPRIIMWMDFYNNHCIRKFMAGKEIIVAHKNFNSFVEKILPISSVIYKKDVIKKLPKQIVYNKIVDLSEQQKTISKTLKDSTDNPIEIITFIRVCENGINELMLSETDTVKTLRLEKEISNKLLELFEIIENHSEPIIIFTQFKRSANEIYKYLNKTNKTVSLLTGDSSIEKRNSEIERFKNNGIDILIATDILSQGINLSDINILINYDLPYNPAKIKQRIGRIIRIDSNPENQKIIYNLISDGFEKYIFKIINERQKVFDLMMNKINVDTIDNLNMNKEFEDWKKGNINGTE